MLEIIGIKTIRGSSRPLEWDYASSKTTVYHNTDIKEIKTEDGRIEWEYGQQCFTHEEFPIVLTQLAIKENESLRATLADLTEVVLMGGV